MNAPPGRRAVIRWSWRLFRREWRQQVLVVVLTIVAVAVSVVGSATAINAARTDSSGRFGNAVAFSNIDNSQPATARAGIDALRRLFGPVDVVARQLVAEPGTTLHTEVRDLDPHSHYGKPMLRLVAGRFPTAAGEVALTKGTATELGARLGSTASLSPAVATATVVGLVENPGELRDQFALVAPGTLAAPDEYTVLIGSDPRDTIRPGSIPGETTLALRGAALESEAIWALVLGVITLGMALAGLIAAAGFVVVAQRRQRQLGMLGALGATDRHIRLVMVANGVLVGIVAAAIGTLIGIGGWMLIAPAAEAAAHHRIGRADLPWPLIAVIVALALAMSTVAAWWPARAAARLPVMRALSGRPVPPQPVHRSLALAVALVAGGAASIALAQPREPHIQPILLIAGLVAVVIGTVLAAPAAVRALGPLARRLPLAPRLALRDLSRYQARAAAALAAMTLALSVAIGVVVIDQASQDRTNQANLSENELLVRVGDRVGEADSTLTLAQQAELDKRAAGVIAALGEGVTGVPLDVAFAPSQTSSGLARPVGVAYEVGPHEIQFGAFPYVATPAVLAAYGIDPATIAPETDLLSVIDNGVLVTDPLRPPDPGTPPSPAQHVSLPPYQSAPHALITEAAVARHGWVTARAAWIVESPHGLTAGQIRAVRAAAAGAGLAVEVRESGSSDSALRAAATLIGAVLAIAIVAMAIGLIRGESARDVRTLTATGAAPRTRRALTASAAAALTVPSVVLGTAGAYVALLAAYRTDPGLLLPVPWTNLLTLGLGLPIAATVCGWALAGREPKAFARQLLE